MYEITIDPWKHGCTSFWFIKFCATHCDTMCHLDDVNVRHPCAFGVVGGFLKAETPMGLLSIERLVLNGLNIHIPN